MAVLMRLLGFRRAKKIPLPGRKMNKQEARDYVFEKYGETMSLLAKH